MLARKRGETEIVRVLIAAGGKETTVTKKAEPNGPRELPNGGEEKAIKLALERSIPELQKTALASKDAFIRHASKQDCVSCHQQYVPMAALAFAKKTGAGIDTEMEGQLLAMVRRNGTNISDLTFETTFHPEPAHSYGYELFGLSARQEAPTRDIDAVIHHLLIIQGKDGNWYNNLPRPPIQTSDVGATALAVHALSKYGFPGRRQEIKERIERARQWMRRYNQRTPKSEPGNCLAWSGRAKRRRRRENSRRLCSRNSAPMAVGASCPDCEPMPTLPDRVSTRLRSREQRRTGRVERGLAFLLKSQQEDGTWFVARRAFPFQPTMKSGFSYGRDSWVSSAGTSWATIALALGLPEQRYQASAEQ